MIFLKLGGSLITRKERPQSARVDVISRLANEIAEGFHTISDLKLLIGHGSGSFGHFVADQYKTHLGASSREDWYGFTEVWAAANRLNRLVVDSLLQNGLPILSMPPSASAISERGKIIEMAIEPLKHAMEAGLIPVVQGDVSFDQEQGSAIISTEEVFQYLAPQLKPSLILLAGIEPGVYKDYPDCTELLPTLTEKTLGDYLVAPAATTDVTGGMADKVHQALTLCRSIPNLEVRIFSGEQKGKVRDALAGAKVGTLIKVEDELKN
jgi:isopentenyl phosphate kinase